jgi:hypothetical protein
LQYKFHESDDVFDESRSWRWRVIRASMGTTPGAIVMAMFAKVPQNGPAYGQTCDILPNGIVITPHRVAGKWTEQRPIGSLIAVRDSMRRLADHCKLPDKERDALFEELRKWVRKDYRAVSGV